MKKILGIILAVGLALAMTVPVYAAVSTDQADYTPGSVVTISGDNSNGAGYMPGETVTIAVNGPNGFSDSEQAAVGEDGTWSVQVQLWDTDLAIGEYTYTATSASGVTESGTFTDAPIDTTLITENVTGIYGGSVTLSATLTYKSGSSWLPLSGKTITFQFNTTPVTSIGSATTNASGIATLTCNIPTAVEASTVAYSNFIKAQFNDSPPPTYKTANANANLTVGKATPVFSNLSSPIITAGDTPKSLGGTISSNTVIPSGSVSITLNGVTHMASINSTTGAFSSSFDTSGLNTSGSPYSISYTYAANTNFNGATGSGTLIVNPADTIAPTTFITLSPASPDGTNGWYKSDVTITISASDNTGGSGVAETRSVLDPTTAPNSFTDIASGSSCNGTKLSTDGTHTVYAASKDNSGNIESIQSLSFKIDETAPTLTWGTPDPAANGNGWNNTNVSIPFTTDDATSGVASSDPASPLVLSTEGSNVTGTVTITDNAGNSKTFTSPAVKIDKTKPVIKAGTPTGTQGNNDWWISDVTVPFSATDNLSGFAPNGDLSINLASKTTSGEGTNLTVTSDSISDLASNTATGIQAGPFKVDKTAPTVTQTYPTGPFILHGTYSVTWVADDEISGLATDSSGSVSLNTTTAGYKTLTIPASTDNAGNTTPATTWSYNVVYSFGGILQPINTDGSSIFKFGSTVPVKFQLTDANGAYISTAIAQITVAKISNGIIGDDLEAVSTAAATTGNLFRYDSTANQYIFNLSTKPLSQGTWRITITLDDGCKYSVNISLK